MPSVDRNIRKSVMAWVRAFFVSPPAWTGLSAFNVYGETALRSYQETNTEPTRPYLFLLDSYIRPVQPLLPVVVVEVGKIANRPYELGNRKGREPEVLVHFFGRTRGERDDLAGFFKDYVLDQGYVPIYSYTSGSSVFTENALVMGEVISEQVAQRSDALREEGSLDLWEIVSFGLMNKL